MAKIEMNNEIVLLRHTVRQARVCVVNKLTKEAKLLQNKHGNEAQQEKYKRKANKIVAEIHALKIVKEDDISKFGIINERNLTEILQDHSLSDSDRIMARIVHYKTLSNKITQFKKKFQDCKKYLTEERKKTGKLKSKTETKNMSTENNSYKQDKGIKKHKILVDERIENYQDSFEDDDKNPELSEVKNISHECQKLFVTTLESDKVMETQDSNMLHDEIVDKQPNMTNLCSVTREAVVKTFTELLEEQDSSEEMPTLIENRDSAETTVMQKKVVDDFFITGDNQEDYKRDDNILTSDMDSYKSNSHTRAFPSSNRFPKQNAKYKNDEKFNKNQRYDELRYKPSMKNSNQNKKYLGKEASMRPEKRGCSKINNNAKKNNLNIKNTEENSDLHPSWLAKKKQQEIMSQGFQGKKIVFSDD